MKTLLFLFACLLTPSMVFGQFLLPAVNNVEQNKDLMKIEVYFTFDQWSDRGKELRAHLMMDWFQPASKRVNPAWLKSHPKAKPAMEKYCQEHDERILALKQNITVFVLPPGEHDKNLYKVGRYGTWKKIPDSFSPTPLVFGGWADAIEGLWGEYTYNLRMVEFVEQSQDQDYKQFRIYFQKVDELCRRVIKEKGLKSAYSDTIGNIYTCQDGYEFWEDMGELLGHFTDFGYESPHLSAIAWGRPPKVYPNPLGASK